jgi:hypothetical protein
MDAPSGPLRMDGYARFNEFEDVVVSVELVALLARLLDEHPSYWKWVIIAAQGALQGAMVCALANPTSNSSPTRGKFPNERLEEFNVLLCRCTSGPEPLLKLTSEQKRDIKQLHDHFRNNFAHFVPQGWAIPKLELPPIISAALYAVERLMTEWPVSSHVSERQQDRFSKALQEWKKAPLPSL